jgi:UDP-3-O-[3-hydroxymyristoyl] glucosamine N-acyltransferase
MYNLENFSVRKQATVRGLCDAIGQVIGIDGPEDLVVASVAPLDGGNADALTFCRYTGERAESAIADSPCGAVVCAQNAAGVLGKTLIRVADPRGWFIDALNILNPQAVVASVHEFAVVSKDAVIGADVEIGPNAVVEEGAVIGNGCRIGPFCFVGAAATLGDRVVLQQNTVVGSQGLSFHERPNGDHVYFQHMGRAIIGDDTTIGTHSTVVRGILKNTQIGTGCEIGNYVNIGHNCLIDDGVFISSSTVLTGGVSVGAKTRIGAGVLVSAHCSVGRNARIGLGSVVVKDVEDGKRVFGNPARPLPTMRDF